MSKALRPWQQNLRKIPQHILDAVDALPQDACVVACMRKIRQQDIVDGVYRDIGVQWDHDRITFPEAVIPLPGNGSYSRTNVRGKSIPLKNLPMVNKTYSITTPNYGDWSKGSHDVSWDRDIYQRRYIPPKELAIRIEQVAEDLSAGALVFRFTVDDVLDRWAANFQEQLLFNLNLLQENVGNHGVFPSDASMAEYLKTLYVNWELLPPGERDDNLARIFRTVKDTDPRLRQQITARYDALARLKPLRFIRGTNGLRNYFGAQFAPDLVVFENIEYGNAIYVMFEDWEVLSRKSRMDLLSQHPDQIVRIPHTKTWRVRLGTLVRKELTKRPQP